MGFGIKHRWITLRTILGVTIMLGVFATHFYNEFFPLDTERIIEETRISLEKGREANEDFRKLETDEFGYVKKPPIAEVSGSENGYSRITDYIILLLRSICFLLGIVLLYFSLFLYEDEQGKLQNRLETWWVRIVDIQNASLSAHLKGLRVLADISNHLLNFVFGKKTLSLRAAGVSACFAFSSANLYCYFNGWESILENYLFNAIYWFLLGIVPSLVFDRTSRLLWYYCLVFILWHDLISGAIIGSIFALAIEQNILVFAFLGFPLVLGLACLFSFISLALIRFLLRKVLESGIVISTSIWLFLLSVPGLMFLEPFYLLRIFPDNMNEWAMFTTFAVLLIVVAVNSFLFMPSLFFLGLAAALALHSLLGSFAHRFIYALQKLEVGKRSKLLFAVACLCTGFGVGLESKIWQVIEKAIF